MDFMNLNQSAHGDREFGFLATRMQLRRKMVVGHWQRRVGRRAGSAPGRGRRAAGTRRRVSRSPASATTCGRSRSPRATRSRPRSGSGISVNGYGVGELADAVARVADSAVDRLVGEYEQAVRRRAARSATGGERRESLRDAARIEAGLRAFLEAGGFKAFTDTFEDLHGLRAAARASPSSG